MKQKLYLNTTFPHLLATEDADDFTVVTAGNLILGKLARGTQVRKNHCNFPAQSVINKLKIYNFFSMFGQIFSRIIIISGK